MTKFTPQNLRTSFAVYQVLNEGGEPVYLWFSKLADVYLLRPLMKNPAFDPSKSYTVQILEVANSIMEANNRAGFHIRQKFGDSTPFFNLTSYHNLHGTIICEQTGEIFFKQSDICRRYKCTPSQISSHLRGVLGYNSVKGYTFRRADFMGTDKQKQSLPRVPTKPMYKADARTRQPVQCNQTGQVFASQIEAAKAMGINKGQLSQHLQGRSGYKTIKGMTFTLVPAVPSPMPLHPVQTVQYSNKEGQ